MDAIIWGSKYSLNNESDKFGRWARCAYFKNLLIGWINRIEHNHKYLYEVNTYFPIRELSDCPYGNEMFHSYGEAKRYIETEWWKFTEKIKT